MSSLNDEDDLDAFFRAAENNDSAALTQAADYVASTSLVDQPAGPPPSGGEPKNELNSGDTAFREDLLSKINYYPHSQNGEPKFIAIEPQNADADGDPFVLVPHGIPGMLPWWVWTSVAIVLCSIFLAVMFIPRIELSNLTARLGDNQASSQSAMRQLVMRGDENTVNKLYELAASQSQDISARLRAIDALSLIAEPAAARALLRLELADSTDSRIRQHAIAVRKQREAASVRRAQER